MVDVLNRFDAVCVSAFEIRESPIFLTNETYQGNYRISFHANSNAKIICFQCKDVNVLLDRIKTRGRQEEQSIKSTFLEGLNGYYTAFPSSVRSKHKVDVMTWDVSKWNIHDPEQAKAFLSECEGFFAA